MTLTIPEALELLRNIPIERQRDLNWSAVYSYLKQIRAGEIIRPIEIEEGKLVNGQHRVMAFILSEEPEIIFRKH